MRNTLKTLVILLFIAVVPVRALAAVTIGFCPSGHQDMAATVQADHGHEGGTHAQHGEVPPGQASDPSCNVCAEHCSSAAFAPSVPGAMAARAVGQDRTRFAERNAQPALPDQLDRPPLA